MPSKQPKMTIKRFAHEYFVKVSFVDIYGRNIGYDYSTILAEIKKHFPHANTSRRWLQDMAYVLNRSERLPVRRRSRRALAQEYALSMLLRQRNGAGLKYASIGAACRSKFPDQRTSVASLRKLEGHLRRLEFTVPTRPA